MIQSAFASPRGAADTNYGNCVIGRSRLGAGTAALRLLIRLIGPSIDGAPRRTAAPAETPSNAFGPPQARSSSPEVRSLEPAVDVRMTSGWVLRKVKQNDKWVRRWLEVNRHVLYSYQACPAESPQARVINMLDLRKISEIKLVDDGVAGLFSIVPVSADDQHPGYLMRADTAAKAQEWVSDLNKVRDQELAAAKAEPAVCDQLKTKDDQLKLNDEVLAELNDELLAELAVCKEQLKAKDIQLKLAVCEEKLQANEDLLKAKDENLKLSMELVALKDELAKAKQASKGKPLACVTNAQQTPPGA